MSNFFFNDLKHSQSYKANEGLLSYPLYFILMLIFLFIVIFSALLVLVLLARECKKLSHDNASLSSEVSQANIKLSASQIKPHYLFNVLSSIQTIMLIDANQANGLLGDFITHLRCNTSYLLPDKKIPFDDELENIKAYGNIEKMRLGDRLELLYDIGYSDFNIYPLMLQPLVENAIRHGIYPKEGTGGFVKLSTKLIEDQIIITIEDNGVGFSHQSSIAKNSEDYQGCSVGLENTVFRLKTLLGASFRLHSSPNDGTLITITIPKALCL